MTHPLRDLAAKLRKVCQDHDAYTQAVEIVENCAGHLEAVARTHEANEEIQNMTEAKKYE